MKTENRAPMLKRLLTLALVFLITTVACGIPVMASPSTPEASPVAVAQLWIVTPGPDATATPTPFQPIGPTATSRPTFTPTPVPTATPDAEATAAEAERAIPTPIRVKQKLPEGVYNFLVLGSDSRPGGGFRTDVIMLVSVNSGRGTVNVVSFPRDLYVTIPGWTTQRINTAFQYGGFDTLAATMEYNFGVRPSFYIMTNFEEFVGIVNSLGGIEVEVAEHLSDSCDLPQARGGRCTVDPGTVTMDGAFALWYVRSRHSSSDFDRLRRAQEVLYGLFRKMMSGDVVTRVPEMYSMYRSSIDTNMGVEDIIPLLPVASEVIRDPGRVNRYSVGPGYVYNFITQDGAMVLLPDYAAIQALLAQAVYGQ